MSQFLESIRYGQECVVTVTPIPGCPLSRLQQGKAVMTILGLNAVKSLAIVDEINRTGELETVVPGYIANQWLYLKCFKVDVKPANPVEDDPFTSQRDLLDRGVAGDADAAIEFCKLFASGHVTLNVAFA